MKCFRQWLEDRLLHLGSFIVPRVQRAEWLRSWTAELWFERDRGNNNLSMGIFRDALWLRADYWRQALAGTALLCLLTLALLALIAGLPVFFFAEDSTGLSTLLSRMLPRFAVAASLTLIVSYTTSVADITVSASGSHGRRFCAWGFLSMKALLLLTLSSLVSIDLCFPLEVCGCFAALPLELLLFVVLSLLGLRWNFLDGQARCKHCLRSLAPPRRVGRPSRNFLEYNGTELACTEGHGLLSVPEMESSWCSSSAWVAQTSPYPLSA